MIDWHQESVTVASAISATVLNALWQDALIVLCVWLLLRAWPRINAATRYVVWSATLAAAFVVPIATTFALFTPAQTVPANETQTTSILPASGIRVPRHEIVASTVAARTLAPPAPERLRVTLSAPLAIGISTLWLLLAAYALLRLAIGLLRLEQLKRDALPLPVEYRDAMPQWLGANKGARGVRLCVSDETDVPIAVGLFDAMILIPRVLLERLSEPEVDQVCLHELAHLRRADDWTNGLQRVINALLGWNPAALFIGRQLDLEREVACDDWVLSFVGTVRPYALCLTKMAESASWPRRPIPAPGVFATRRHISLRIERLLGVGRNIATNLALGPAAAAVAVVAAIAVVIAVVAPSVAAAPIVAQAGKPIAPVAAATAKKATPERHVAPGKGEARVTRVTTVATPMPATSSAKPKAYVEVPAMHLVVPPVNVQVPATKVEVPAMKVVVPATRVEIPQTTFEVPGFNAKQFADTVTRNVASGVMQGLHGTSIAQGNSCVGCDYSGVNWAGRDLHGVIYNGVDFSRANLAGANLSGSSLLGADFRRANLSGASFRHAHLSGCDFSDANLGGADFTAAAISGCQFTRARLGSSQLRDVLNGCKGCDFNHADLGGLDLHGVRTNGDDFSGANLRNVNFAGAELVGTDFSNANLAGANLAGATLKSCDLSGVDLSRVDLSKTKLIDTDVRDQ